MDAPPVQYVTTTDGFNLAYTVSGEGQPLVLMPGQGSHLQLNWKIAIHSDWLEGLQSRFKLICYDGRGQGMSTRSLPPTFRLAHYLRDLETVVEHLSLDHFVLAAHYVHCHVAIQYAVAHPQRVKALILKHGSLQTRAATGAHIEAARENWAHFLVLITGMLPGNNREETVNFLRQSVTQQDWLTIAERVGTSDISATLPGLHIPTLLLHARDFPGLHPEEGAGLAAAIRGAQLVLTEGSSYEIDAAQGLQAIDAFLAELPQTAAAGALTSSGLHALSSRQLEVLQLLSQGKTNRQIADQLVLSERTIERHISDIYHRLDVSNRAQAAVYAQHHGLV